MYNPDVIGGLGNIGQCRFGLGNLGRVIKFSLFYKGVVKLYINTTIYIYIPQLSY